MNMPKRPSKKCKTCYGSGVVRQLAQVQYEVRGDCPACQPERNESCKQHRKREGWVEVACGCLRPDPEGGFPPQKVGSTG